MGIFLHTVLFPGGREEECREALARCGADPQLGLRPADCRWRQCARGPAVLLNDGFAGAELLAARLSFRLEYPLMVLFLYDGDFWGYCLWQKGAEIHQQAHGIQSRRRAHQRCHYLRWRSPGLYRYLDFSAIFGLAGRMLCPLFPARSLSQSSRN